MRKAPASRAFTQPAWVRIDSAFAVSGLGGVRRVTLVERGGKTLLSFREEDTCLAPAVDALALAVRDGRCARGADDGTPDATISGVATTLPVIPSPKAYFPRSISSKLGSSNPQVFAGAPPQAATRCWHLRSPVP